MRIFLKLLAAPLVVILTVLWAVLVFLFGWAKMLMRIVSGLTGLCAIIMFITGGLWSGFVLAVMAFLTSPVGIPAISDWLTARVAVLNDGLKTFIATS